MLLSFLHVSLLASAVAAATADCPTDDWKSWGGMCYWLSDYTLNWRNVDRVCDGMFSGATGASVHDMDLEAFLSENLLNKQKAWLGLRRASSTSAWVWSDGTPLDFTMWGGGQPNEGGEACGTINWTYGTWGDYNCDTYYALFVCQIHA